MRELDDISSKVGNIKRLGKYAGCHGISRDLYVVDGVIYAIDYEIVKGFREGYVTRDGIEQIKVIPSGQYELIDQRIKDGVYNDQI